MNAMSLGISLGTRPAAVLVGDDGTVVTGIVGRTSSTTAVAELLDQVLRGHDVRTVARVMVAGLGETSTAVIPRDAERVGVLRLAAPTTTSVPPMFGWPQALTAIVGGPTAVVAGGHDYDGRPRCELDIAAVEEFARTCRANDIRACAVVGTNSQSASAHETAAASTVADILGPGTVVTLGGAAGGIGLIERENVTILDAATTARTERVAAEMAQLLGNCGVDAPMHVIGGDGTLMSVPDMIGQPSRVRESTRAGALAGIRHEHSLEDALVVHESPTYTYVTAIADGIPWESHHNATVFGVPTSSTGLWKTRIDQRSMSPKLPQLIARMRSWLGQAPVVLLTASSATNALCPPPILHSQLGPLAGAVGAATAHAGGSVDRVYRFVDRTYAECVAAARADAVDAAIRAGADPARIEIVRFRDTPLTYVTSTCVRLSAMATGPLE
ncbi:hypothetical protein ABH922_000102 [Rhodococcus sp. 27YEA15]|uniref:hydantoinase/oxoprolinase N-terminal domain-containing protein n=1 Tax=Rhodococcus sp. 27YEA15 TaxID=3156259 RepID=UPI003C7B109A